jgi:hypothetical protein
MNTDAPTAQQIARIRRYQEILTDFGRMAPDASDNARVLQLACVQASRGIGIGHTKVMRFRPEAGDLLIVAGVGWHPGVVGHIALGTDLASPPGRTFPPLSTTCRTIGNFATPPCCATMESSPFCRPRSPWAAQCGA